MEKMKINKSFLVDGELKASLFQFSVALGENNKLGQNKSASLLISFCVRLYILIYVIKA